MDLAARCLTAHRVGGDYYDFIPTTFEQTALYYFPRVVPVVVEFRHWRCYGQRGTRWLNYGP